MAPRASSLTLAPCEHSNARASDAVATARPGRRHLEVTEVVTDLDEVRLVYMHARAAAALGAMLPYLPATSHLREDLARHLFAWDAGTTVPDEAEAVAA